MDTFPFWFIKIRSQNRLSSGLAVNSSLGEVSQIWTTQHLLLMNCHSVASLGSRHPHFLGVNRVLLLIFLHLRLAAIDNSIQLTGLNFCELSHGLNLERPKFGTQLGRVPKNGKRMKNSGFFANSTKKIRSQYNSAKLEVELSSTQLGP